jgi:alanine dehydrogenase
VKLKNSGTEKAMRIGIRREDKNQWEGRAPLTPDNVRNLVETGIEVYMQPSGIRIFPDDDYRKAGAVIDEDLSSCPVILGVKEMPLEFFHRNKTYVFFSHTIKGQKQNMPMLRKMMDLGCHLIDYELIADDKGRRLIFFGKYAGLAGMIDTLWALGKRLEWEGIPGPFGEIKTAHEYASLSDAKAGISAVGERIKRDVLPNGMNPLICGFAGYGHVSGGAQEIFDILPHEQVPPADLAKIWSSKKNAAKKLFKVVFKEEDMVEPIDPSGAFDLQDYYNNPQKYGSGFEKYLPYLTVLVNCIYWDERYPRLVTLEYLRSAYSAGSPQTLRVIGDISCDIGGSIECTVKATDPGNPVYVYNPIDSIATDGWAGKGPVIMAVDNLPCELSRESSEFFGKTLMPFIPQLARTDLDVPFDKIDLPGELSRAIILHRGKLTPKFESLSKYL